MSLDERIFRGLDNAITVIECRRRGWIYFRPFLRSIYVYVHVHLYPIVRSSVGIIHAGTWRDPADR